MKKNKVNSQESPKFHMDNLNLKSVKKGLLSKFKRLFKFSISFKLSFFYSLILSFALFTLSLFVIIYFAFFLIDTSLDKVDSTVQKLSKSHIEAELNPSQLSNEVIISDMDFNLYSEDSRLVLATDEKFKAISLRDDFGPMNLDFHQTSDGLYLMRSKKIQIDGDYYFITSLLLLNNYINYVLGLAITLFLVSVLLFFSLPVLAFRISNKMLLPIKTMTKNAKEISMSSLDKRLDVSSSQDELKDLSETFNRTLDRLQTSYTKQYQFISDASHELRTPISVIQGYANLLDRWGKNDREVLEESIKSIKNESENMKELIEKLLFIARTENSSQQVEKTLFNLNELFSEIIKECQLIDNSHIFYSYVEGNVSIYADRKLLKQALRVFIDNSIKYTPDGKDISLVSRESKGNIFIQIIDSGLGIPKNDLPKIFDRFYRSDESRDKKSGGTGLGLTIAKIILDLHDAEIKIFSEVDKGTEILIILKNKVD